MIFSFDQITNRNIVLVSRKFNISNKFRMIEGREVQENMTGLSLLSSGIRSPLFYYHKLILASRLGNLNDN